MAEIDGRVVGWLRAHVEPQAESAAIQVIREPGWTRLLVDALVVDCGHWRRGAGWRNENQAEPAIIGAQRS